MRVDRVEFSENMVSKVNSDCEDALLRALLRGIDSMDIFGFIPPRDVEPRYGGLVTINHPEQHDEIIVLQHPDPPIFSKVANGTPVIPLRSKVGFTMPGSLDPSCGLLEKILYDNFEEEVCYKFVYALVDSRARIESECSMNDALDQLGDDTIMIVAEDPYGQDRVRIPRFADRPFFKMITVYGENLPDHYDRDIVAFVRRGAIKHHQRIMTFSHPSLPDSMVMCVLLSLSFVSISNVRICRLEG